MLLFSSQVSLHWWLHENQISFYETSQPKNSPEADPCIQKNDSIASALRAPQMLHQEGLEESSLFLFIF